MELIEIRSSSDLTAKVPEARRPDAHSYKISCRQFIAVRREWQRNTSARGQPLGLMTLGLDRIWITEEEVKKVVGAIEEARSPVSLD
jgi:hypothetical protein